MNRKMKISLAGTLIGGNSLCLALPLAICASTTKEETPSYKSLSGHVYYSFSHVIANRIVLIDGINGRVNVYYLSVRFFFQIPLTPYLILLTSNTFLKP